MAKGQVQKVCRKITGHIRFSAQGKAYARWLDKRLSHLWERAHSSETRPLDGTSRLQCRGALAHLIFRLCASAIVRG